MSETDPNITLLLGEVRGQLRELIHGMNNQSMKNDAFARQLAKLETVPDQLAKLEARMEALETIEQRRDGALGLGKWLINSPLAAWVVTLLLGVWAYLKGAFHS